ncbi:Sterol uptake control protein 2 [Fusarium oxysporum f. sp. albedinis]|nr:Sterol uptake control protein 2 [Fusarium oxysporum f. sp. albedinis]
MPTSSLCFPSKMIGSSDCLSTASCTWYSLDSRVSRSVRIDPCSKLCLRLFPPSLLSALGSPSWNLQVFEVPICFHYYPLRSFLFVYSNKISILEYSFLSQPGKCTFPR